MIRSAASTTSAAAAAGVVSAGVMSAAVCDQAAPAVIADDVPDMTTGAPQAMEEKLLRHDSQCCDVSGGKTRCARATDEAEVQVRQRQHGLLRAVAAASTPTVATRQLLLASHQLISNPGSGVGNRGCHRFLTTCNRPTGQQVPRSTVVHFSTITAVIWEKGLECLAVFALFTHLLVVSQTHKHA